MRRSALAPALAIALLPLAGCSSEDGTTITVLAAASLTEPFRHLDLASGVAINLNARLDDNSAFGTFFTYRAGVAYSLRSGTRIRASLGRSFKAPTFCEQFCDAPFVVGDSTLRPERSTSWEAGVEQSLAGGRVSVWATYFDQRFRDMIVYDGNGLPGEPTYRNGAAAESRGIEAGLTTSLGSEVNASASYTLLSTEATDDAGLPSPSFAAGERLIRRPRHSAEVAIRGRLVDRLSLGGSVVYTGARSDVDFNQFPAELVELPAYTTVNIAGELEIIHGAPGRPGSRGPRSKGGSRGADRGHRRRGRGP